MLAVTSDNIQLDPEIDTYLNLMKCALYEKQSEIWLHYYDLLKKHDPERGEIRELDSMVDDVKKQVGNVTFTEEELRKREEEYDKSIISTLKMFNLKHGRKEIDDFKRRFAEGKKKVLEEIKREKGNSQ